MVRITNAKLSSVAPPVWRRYAGASLLYDGPGAAASFGVEPLEELAARHRDDRLYRRLRALAGEFAAEARACGVEVCLVPAHTYHVTLCDGAHEGVRTSVHAAYREEVGATLDEVPDSLLWSNSVMRLLRDPEIRWRVWRDPITFRVEDVGAWGHALVARLAPAGERSLAAKARHEASREEFAARLRSRVGVEVQPWRPHVTLGYFANGDDADRAREELVPGWQAAVQARTEEVSVTFHSASVYGFTDMVSYWRLGH